MNERPKSGPHHAEDTVGGILIEFVADFVPHDSPEFIEHARKGRLAGAPPIPDYLKGDSKKNLPST